MDLRDDVPRDDGASHVEEEFLLREGLDLLATFRSIRSIEARRAIMVMIAAVAKAEREAARR